MLSNYLKTHVSTRSFDFKWIIEKFSEIKSGTTIHSQAISPFNGFPMHAIIKKISLSENTFGSYDDYSATEYDQKSRHSFFKSSYDLFLDGHSQALSNLIIKFESNESFIMNLKLLVTVYDKDEKIICKPNVKIDEPNKVFSFALKSENGSYDLDNIKNDIVTFVFSMKVKGVFTDNASVHSSKVSGISSLSTLSNDLKKMYDSSSVGADIIFIVNGVSIYAHKFLLSMRSEHFKKLLLGDVKGADIKDTDIKDTDVKDTDVKEADLIDAASIADIIIIDDVEPDVFKCLLEYLYTGNVLSIDFGILKDLLHVAKNYSIPELYQICEKKLLAKISLDNAHELVGLAETLKDKNMLKQVVDFINCNMSNIEMNDEVCKYLSKDLSNVDLKELVKNVLLRKCSSNGVENGLNNDFFLV